jgi:molybdate transport system permease protein
MNYDAAHSLSLMLLIFAFVTLFVVYSINRRFEVAKL